MMGAWGQVFAAAGRPEMVFGGTVNLQNCCIGGIHPSTGQRFISYTWSEGGQGARAYGDGPSFAMFLYGAGAQNQPIEVHERWYPFLYEKFEVAVDSSGRPLPRPATVRTGAGKSLATPSTRFTGTESEVTPPGVGGRDERRPQPARPKHGRAGKAEFFMFATNMPLRKVGDTVDFISNGGGGFGIRLSANRRQCSRR